MTNTFNLPDAWEKQSLVTVSQSNWEVNKGIGEAIPGQYRYLKPIYVKQSCLGCHGNPVGTEAPLRPQD